jgi:hypothetical protein
MSLEVALGLWANSESDLEYSFLFEKKPKRKIAQ